MRIVFIQPTSLDDHYYRSMTALMRHAADRLGVELEVRAGAGGPEWVHAQVDDLLGAPASSRPDAVLAVNDRSSAVHFIPRLSQAELPVLLISQDLLRTERHDLGEPGELHRHWIGSLVPDDQQAGRLLAASLLEKARSRGLAAQDGSIQVIALGGTYTAASIQRITGLRRALADHPGDESAGAVLAELLPGHWQRDRAALLVEDRIRRDPEVTIVWAANDAMALGAADAFAAVGREPGRDVLIGGIDWAPIAVEAIDDGRLTVSVGGHFLEGARAILALHDRHHGVPFDPPLQRTGFAVLDARSLDRVRPLFDPRTWRRIDLRKFSRTHDPSARPLTVDALLADL